MTYIDDHMGELIARYAAEDNCAPEEWEDRAVRSVVRQRHELETALAEARTRVTRSTPRDYADCAIVRDARGKDWKYSEPGDVWCLITGSLGPGSVGGPDWSARSWQRLLHEFGPVTR